jgi:hypothetical protein
MRPANLKKLIVDTHPSLRTLCIEGPPGVGKTSLVEEAGQEMGIPVITRHMPTMVVEDFGVPDMMTSDTSFGYKMPEWFPYQGKPGTERGGILLFDDRNQCSPDLQKVMANICQARTLHGVPLADGWRVISTGNRVSDRAGSNKVLSHLRNRETVVTLDVHLDDWSSWALANNVPTSLVSFFRYRPALLNDFDPQREVNPTCRSWSEGVAPFIGKIDPAFEMEFYSGSIGEGAAAEFLGFMRIVNKLPNIDRIILDPDNSPVPDDPATLYALSGALAARVTQQNLGSILRYGERMPGEFTVLTVSMAVRRDQSLCDTSAFAQFAMKNGNLLW